MEISYGIVLIFIISGILVGFINTLAGGGTIISMTTFMIMGLPLTDANGTNRIAVVLQNLTSSVTFFKKKLLDVRVGLKLSIPAIIGNLIGSQIASTIDANIFRWCLAVVLFIILVFMVLSTDQRLKGDGSGVLKIRPIHYLWFLLIGFYGGYIYVGLGYLILAVTVMSMRMDIVTSNAIKGFVVLVSTPFSLAVFMWNGHVNYTYGLLHAVGNIIGAYIASQYAISWGVRFLRMFMIIVTLVSIADLFNLISLRDLVSHLL